MLQDITQVVLAKALDGTAMRNRAIANNLANVETPGYLRQDVSFESELRAALDSPALSPTSAEGEVQVVEPEQVGDASQPARENGNNVDVDREMARLADNTLRYQALAQSISVKQNMLTTAIYEGRR
jgi:flagellar basal-body rod protein FlgB